MVRDRDVFRRRRGHRELRQRAVFPLHDAVDLRDVDALVKTPVNIGEILVDLQAHDVRVPEDPLGDACRAREIEITVLVHRRRAHHRDVHGEKVPVVRHDIPEDHRNIAAQSPVRELSLVSGAVPAVVDEVFPKRVALHHFDRAKSQIAADLDVREFIAAGGERLVKQDRKADIGAVVDPVAALNAADGLFRCHQFASVFIEIIHSNSSVFR